MSGLIATAGAAVRKWSGKVIRFEDELAQLSSQLQAAHAALDAATLEGDTAIDAARAAVNRLKLRREAVHDALAVAREILAAAWAEQSRAIELEALGRAEPDQLQH